MQRLKNSMKKRSVFILLGIMLLFSFAFVSAQPPFQTSNTGVGIIIEAPVLEYHAYNTDFTFHLHAYNSSDGTRLTNESINCMIHLYDPLTGGHLIENNMAFDSNGIDFEYTVLGGNFTELNQYAVLLDCQDTNIGGFLEYGFDVTKNGKMFNTSESLVYFILALGVFLLFALSFYFMISTPYKNEVDNKGAVIKITKLKYVKLGLILLTWVLFTWLLNILIGLSDTFVSLTMYYGFFGFIFDVMNRLALPVGLVVLIISLFELVRDFNLYGNIKKFGSAYK